MPIAVNQTIISELSYNIASNSSDTIVTLTLNLTPSGCGIEEEVGDKVTVNCQLNHNVTKPCIYLQTLNGIITEKKISGTVATNKLPTVLVTIFCAKQKWKVVKDNEPTPPVKKNK